MITLEQVKSEYRIKTINRIDWYLDSIIEFLNNPLNKLMDYSEVQSLYKILSDYIQSLESRNEVVK